MKATFPQYMRVQNKSGGVWASDRAIVKGSHTLLSQKGKSRARRTARHEFIRSILWHHKNAQMINRKF